MARRDSEEEKQRGAEGAQTEMDQQAAAGDQAAMMGENEAGRSPRLGLRAPAQMATEEVAAPVVGFVRDTLSGAIQATGAVASDAVEVVRDVLTGTLHATEEVGSETLGAVSTLGTGLVTTARDILVGGVTGIKQILGSAMPERRGNGGWPERRTAGDWPERRTPGESARSTQQPGSPTP